MSTDAKAAAGERILDRLFNGVARRTRGVRRLRRPATTSTPEFDLTYVRSGPGDGRPPAVVIPGGPGLASILPYRTLRRLATRSGLDLIMIEHRGVGLSRKDTSGRDLPRSAMRIRDVVDDIAAVLDHEGVTHAHIVGSSYGSYVAAGFGVTHPDRVAGMLLDSALQCTDDMALERSVIRALFWDGPGPAASAVRRLAESGMDERILLDVVRAAYELGGDELLLPLLQRRERGGRGLAWRALESYAARDASIARIPAVYEFDLVGTIGFQELGYGAAPDGLPLDPALTCAPLAEVFPPFAGEPYDLAGAVGGFDWPLVLLSGSRDLRTPPAIAQRVADAAARSVLVSIRNGHSALETHPLALLKALEWLVDGRQDQLPDATDLLDGLPLRGIAARLPQFLRAALRVGRPLG